MRESDEARWFYSVLASVGAGASLPRAFLQAGGIQGGLASQAKMHVVRGLPPERFRLPSRGWNALLGFLVRAHKKMPSLAGPSASKLLLLLYQNRILVEEWEARRRAHVFKGLIMVSILALVLPLLLHLSSFLALAWHGGVAPSSPTMTLWGLALLMVSSHLYATVLGEHRNPWFILIPPILYYASHTYAARTLPGMGA